LFFFQAEDGIRDKLVTGVQTCALPISSFTVHFPETSITLGVKDLPGAFQFIFSVRDKARRKYSPSPGPTTTVAPSAANWRIPPRSEERRVGKECRSRWAPAASRKYESY